MRKQLGEGLLLSSEGIKETNGPFLPNGLASVAQMLAQALSCAQRVALCPMCRQAIATGCEDQHYTCDKMKGGMRLYAVSIPLLGTLEAQHKQHPCPSGPAMGPETPGGGLYG